MSIRIFSWKVNRIATIVINYNKIYEARDAFLISDIAYIDLAKDLTKYHILNFCIHYLIMALVVIFING